MKFIPIVNLAGWLVLATIISLSLTIAPALADGPLNDGYRYQDNFEESVGLNLAETRGFRHNEAGYLEATGRTATAVSTCISLPQPQGGSFTRFSFADINLSHLTDSVSQTLEIETCAGQRLKHIANLSPNCQSIDLSDLSQTAIRLKLTVRHNGYPGLNTTPARLNSWQVVGQAEGVTQLRVTTANSKVRAGNTVTFILNLASDGAQTRNPILRFSLDEINQLGGLAEDATLDYGDGPKSYRPLAFVSATNGPQGEVPIRPDIGATRGEVRWALNDLSDGFADNVQVTLRVPSGYIHDKVLAGRAELTHGQAACSAELTNRMTISDQSSTVTVTSVFEFEQKPYTAEGYVWAGRTGVRDSFYTNPAKTLSDIENLNVIITGTTTAGYCTPLYRASRYRANGEQPVAVREPKVGQPITVDNPVQFHLNRLDNQKFHQIDIFYDVPADCPDGSKIGLVSTFRSDTPMWTDVDVTNHDVVLNVCRKGHSHIHRIQSGTLIGNNYQVWPGWREYYITNGSIKAGEYFSSWMPYSTATQASHTIPLSQSYVVVTVPRGITFHGLKQNPQQDESTTRLYKDCTGTAPVPTDLTFDHSANPPHPAWKSVSIPQSTPFTHTPAENDPLAVVGPQCRLLSVKDDDPAGSYWRPTALWRVCDGRYGCQPLPDDTLMAVVGGKLYAYEHVTNAAGVAHQCESYTGLPLYKETKSWPKVYAAVVENDVPASETAQIIINPENSNKASQYVDGRWGLNLYSSREAIDFTGITGEVLAEESQIPAPDQNIIGQHCNLADISFHVPNKAQCLATATADDPACFAYWNIPAACQPPNGWGLKEKGNYDKDNYQQFLRLQLNAPILNTIAAGTELTFTAEVRTTDLSALGADNAVDPARWSTSQAMTTTRIIVADNPALDAANDGPQSALINHSLSYRMQVKNIGNSPNAGVYLVSQLPRAGVDGSEVTPDYQHALVNLPPSQVIIETTSEANCFSSPVAASWQMMSATSTITGFYQTKTVDPLPSNATCLRIRLAEGSSLTPSELLQGAVELTIPNDESLLGRHLVHRLLTGASDTFGGSANLAPLETAPVNTLIQGENAPVILTVSKSHAVDVTRPGWLKWTLTVRNVSGVTGTAISLTDLFSDTLRYAGLAEPLPGGLTCHQADCAIEEANPDGSGGQIGFSLTELAPADSSPGGPDEATVSLWTQLSPNLPAETVVKNCARLSWREGNENTCMSTTTFRGTAIKQQQVSPERTGTPPELYPGDTVRYSVVVTNSLDKAVYLTIYDMLPAQVSYLSGTLQINGATASDAAMSGGQLTYRSTEAVGANEALQVSFEGKVTPNSYGKTITNIATVTACADRLELASCHPAQATNIVEAVVSSTIPTTSLTLIKKANEQPTTGVFSFTGDLGAFELAADEAITFTDLASGTYSIQESNRQWLSEQYWALISVSCVDKATGHAAPQSVMADLSNYQADISLAAGQQLSCTFENNRADFEKGDTVGRIFIPLIRK